MTFARISEMRAPHCTATHESRSNVHSNSYCLVASFHTRHITRQATPTQQASLCAPVCWRESTPAISSRASRPERARRDCTRFSRVQAVSAEGARTFIVISVPELSSLLPANAQRLRRTYQPVLRIIALGCGRTASTQPAQSLRKCTVVFSKAPSVMTRQCMSPPWTPQSEAGDSIAR